MEFQPEHAEDFLAHFKSIAHLIRAFPGVAHLELHRDAEKPNVFYTYSQWAGTDDLEVYRQSELFKTTWAKAKTWFAGKPQAFSLQQEMVFS